MKAITGLRRYPALDGLRGVAATAVMLAHFAAMTPYTPDFNSWAGYGVYGVELFFMISGFVIPLSLSGKSLRSFVLSRFIRLYPIFWVCMAVSWVVRTTLLPSPQDISAARMLANATMIPNQFLGIGSYLEGSYWTLEIELYFYATCAVCWFACRRNCIIAVLMALSLLNVVIDATDAIAMLSSYPRLAQSLFMRCYGWFFVQYAHLFLIGVATCFRRQLGMPRYAALLVFATAVGVYHNRNATSFSDSMNAVMVIAMETLFLTAALTPRPEGDGLAVVDQPDSWRFGLVRWLRSLLENPLLLFLGRISYPLYLIHGGIGLLLLSRVTESDMPVSLGILAASALAITVATLLTTLVDEPLRRHLMQRLLTEPRTLPGSS